MAETTAVVLGVLICFGIAIAVRLVMNRITLPYTVVLVAIGFLFTLADPQTYVGLDFTLDPLSLVVHSIGHGTSRYVERDQT
ncbi:hypothetical protein [Halococcus sp. PRR34]|uniref:hypothetical protein n=1 Tax=Halococcus sp. PRR34 TaxID=3020830 RepID=UPI00235F4FDE|nr:hypothetical protein [Halococcus sp. PRR34]